MDQISYDFNEIDLAVRQEIQTTATRLNAALDDLTARIAPLQQVWTREAAQAYLVQQEVAKLAKTAIDYPPMQDPASFNLESVKRKIDAAIKNRPGQ